MKKLYFLFLMTFVAFSVNAQSIYIIGSGDNLDWDPATALEVQKSADNNYTIEIKNLTEFKISRDWGDWTAFNAGALVGKDDGTSKKTNLDKPIKLVAGEANNRTPKAGNYKIVIAGDLSTITLISSTPEPTASKTDVIYFIGSGDGLDWDPATALEVQKSANNNYVVEIKNLTEFKVSSGSGDWNSFNAGALVGKNDATKDEENLGRPIKLVQGEANNLTPCKDAYTIVISGDLSTITLTFSKHGQK